MHTDPDKKRPDKFQQGPWGDVPLSAERAAQEAASRWRESKRQFYKDDGPAPVAFSRKEPQYWNEEERRFQSTPVSDMLHRGPMAAIQLDPQKPEPVTVSRERTVGYWEVGSWDKASQRVVHLHAPDEPKDVPPTQNISLSVGNWEPIGFGEWRRYCTVTYTPAVVQ